MPRHSETRIVPHSAAQMYALVTDVARYPEFLPWVIAMRIRSAARPKCNSSASTQKYCTAWTGISMLRD